MSEYTYADVIIDPEDPRVEIGKEYYFGDNPLDVINKANKNKTSLILDSIYNEGNYRPFFFGRSPLDFFSCVIRKKEPEKKYVPFDLTKEEDRAKLRGAWVRVKDIPAIEYQIYGLNAKYILLGSNMNIETQDLFIIYEFVDGSPCGRLVEEE